MRHNGRIVGDTISGRSGFLNGRGGALNSRGNKSPFPTLALAAHFDAWTSVTSSGGFASQWNDVSGNARHLLQGTGANQPIHLPLGVNNSGTAAAGSTGTTLNLAASALAVDSVYNGMTVSITGGTGSGQSRTITAYVGATKIATVAAWSVTPDATSTYAITATQPSLFFNGTSHFMKCSAFTLNQPETVYMVLKQITWTNTDFIFDGNADLSGGVLQNPASPLLGINAGSTVAQINGPPIGSSGVFAVVFNGASSSTQLNQGAPTVANAGAANMGGFTLGKLGTTAGQFGNFQAYEALIYSAAHDAATRANVIRALQAKWSIP